MSESKKALIRRYYHEVLGGQRIDLLEEIFAVDFAGRMSDGPESDLSEFKAALLTTYSAFPDLKVTVLDQIGEGNKVVTRWRAEGTHEGPYAGVPKGTGKYIIFTGIHIHRVQGNHIVELWEEVNLIGLLQQLGAS